MRILGHCQETRVGPQQPARNHWQALPWAHCVHVVFEQLACIGPSRTCQTAVRDNCVGPHNILLVGGTSHHMGPHKTLLVAGTSPRMGPLHECNIWTISSHWPIKSMTSAAQDNCVGPYNILLAGGTRPCVGPLHVYKICAIGPFWPIKGIEDCHTRLSGGPI